MFTQAASYLLLRCTRGGGLCERKPTSYISVVVAGSRKKKRREKTKKQPGWNIEFNALTCFLVKATVVAKRTLTAQSEALTGYRYEKSSAFPKIFDVE